MSFEESLCWSIGCFPSDLDELGWKYAYNEFRDRIRIKIGEFSTGHLQQAFGMIKVIGMAFGGSKPKETIISDPEEFNRLMG